ncbi:acyltransferase family protein [Phycicoccus duodecadis]|uniref:Peptidoglycan/LPS O-acetylase OafA/YrhL n=1 Tax=Phycicoccus duodecadis TaxID=173053 RepID=A0A2N3YJK5_9MICO|nr:acyltransferase [Phycicoccus duodecadis]PKW27051.1 peptidoglycan/LPS O-acetylase OafA/YrhL [Phycicoccus duodecadis]
MADERFGELDGLRGLAALGVVVYHLTVAYDTVVVGAPPPAFRAPWGEYGVELFFLISGFVILLTARRAHRPSDFVISRLSRLYPTYWLGLAVTLVVVLTSGLFPVPSPATVAANLTMVQRWALVENVDPVYWTLAVEMQFYVGVWLLLLLARRLGTRTVLVATGAWVGVALVVAVLAAPHSHGLDPQVVATPWKVLLNVSLAAYAPLFATGCLAFLARRGEVSFRWPLGAAVAAVVVTLLVRGSTQAVATVVVCALFLAVVARPRTPVLTAAPVRWLGLRSYSLYVCHTAIGYLVVRTLTGALGRDLAMVAALVAVLVAAAVLHEVGEVRGTRAAKAALLAVRGRVALRR